MHRVFCDLGWRAGTDLASPAPWLERQTSLALHSHITGRGLRAGSWWNHGGMGDELTPEISVEVVPETPLETGLTPSEKILAAKLPPEQAKVFREERKAKRAVVTKPAAETAAKPKVEAKPETAPRAAALPEAEEIRFGAEADKADLPAEEEMLTDLSDEELAKLDEKVRKRVAESSKEAVKVRKRAQEAEAKLTEHATKLAERDEELKNLKESLTRGVALAGNSFQQFKDPQAVAQWGTNAQEALVLLRNHESRVKAGRADAADTITHTLPNGQEVELTAADRAMYEARAGDAQAWFEHGEQFSTNKEAATKLAEKHKSTKGYAEARDKYLKDPALHTRIEELVAKAALYDTLESRKAHITFSDTAGAAKNAPSTAAGEEPKKPLQKQPPSETPASVPRLVKTDDAASDLIARKSALMERAMKTEDAGERQKLLKEAIMLGNPAATRAKK